MEIEETIGLFKVRSLGLQEIALTHRTTKQSIRLKAEENSNTDLLLVINYLQRRAEGIAGYVQDELYFLTPFERDFIVTGLNRYNWDCMYTDLKEAPHDGDDNPVPVMFLPLKGERYRCDGKGTGDCGDFSLGYIQQGDVSKPDPWYYRNNDWATTLKSEQMYAIAAKIDQLNRQT